MKCGSIHGRFQPFHNGHLSYALCALEQVDFLFIGITNLFGASSIGVDTAPHRGLIENNPFSYFDRRALIVEGLLSYGINRSKFDVIPFPIEQSENLHQFFPKSLTSFTTVKDEWNKEKIDILRRHAFSVQVLENVERHGFEYASGSRIREMARAGDSCWKNFVPKGVADSLKMWDGFSSLGIDVNLENFKGRAG